MKPNLRILFAELQTLPHYKTDQNKLTQEQGQAIAAKFGEHLHDTVIKKKFNFANGYGTLMMTNPGPAYGKFPNAERLFFSYVYDMHYTAQCEDAEAARNGDYD